MVLLDYSQPTDVSYYALSTAILDKMKSVPTLEGKLSKIVTQKFTYKNKKNIDQNTPRNCDKKFLEVLLQLFSQMIL